MFTRTLACCLLAYFTCAALQAQEPALPPAAKRADFQRHIRPILEQACAGCHGAVKQKGELRLDTKDLLLRGGQSGKVVIPGNSAQSELIRLVARLDPDTAMPPRKEDSLSAEQVGLLRAWIDAGAPWPEGFVIRTSGSVKLDDDELAKLPPPAKQKIDFVRDIQPLFTQRCLGCHGPQRQEVGFRLDHKASLMAGGELGVAIVPGKSEDSLLIHFVAGLRPEGRMPKKGPPLSGEQIGLLRAWIDQGAEFPDSASAKLNDAREHWAFKAPVRPPLPGSKLLDNEARANPIDAFIAARLEQEGLSFSPEADRPTLLRRLHLDLTGLPPTIKELDAFLADQSPAAYERAVERLLASPHYGERWARHWLDAARYADSDGFEKDKPRIAHFYRDWVVNAFNRDLPYDQFVIQQLAGDELPHATQDQLVATGYLRNSMLNEEGGVDPEQFRMEAMFDRMDAVGKGILGLGLNCCQCHTHKYDPITHEEYYRLFAFLNNDHEAQPRVYAPAELMQRADVLRQIAALEQKLQHENDDWQSRMAAWEDAWRAQSRPEWTIVRPSVDKDASGGQRYLPQPDGSIRTAGYQPTKSSCVMTLEVSEAGVTGFRLELLHDPNLPAQGPGRSFMGTFGLSEFKVEALKDGKAAALKIAKATADLAAAPETPVHPNFNEKEPVKRYFGPATYAIDGDNNTGWSSDLGPGRRNFESVAVFTLEKPLAAGEYTIRLVQNIGGWNSDDLQAAQLGRFRLSTTTSPSPAADPVPPHVRAALDVPRAERSPAQIATIFSHWRMAVPEWKEVNARIDALWQQHPEGATQFTLAARDEPRLTSVLKRGDWLKPAQAVTPGVPAILHPLPADAPPTRLTLARWLVDRRSPTTARSLVNRVWQAYFGTGIVATSEDLGTQCEPPSHPQLLDWLAVELMEPSDLPLPLGVGRGEGGGITTDLASRGKNPHPNPLPKGEGTTVSPWSIKHLHRLIVTSRTYRQSSQVSEDLLKRDPYNRLLARGARFRVEGEIVRDIQLAVSGLLNPKLGGRSVMPPAPVFLFQPPASYAPFPWKEETGEDRYRRGLYTWRRRTTPYPFLQTFDTPEGNVACIRRTRANTPLQALVGLNETVSMEAARAFALRILSEGGSSEGERLTYAFRMAVSRPPSKSERAALVALMEKQRPRIADGWINPWEIATGEAGAQPGKLPKNTTPTQLALYTIVSRVLLNLDETITKQ